MKTYAAGGAGGDGERVVSRAARGVAGLGEGYCGCKSCKLERYSACILVAGEADLYAGTSGVDKGECDGLDY